MTTRTLVWQAMFEAETRMRYFYARAGQLQRSDHVLHIILMLFSSATFLRLLGVISVPAQDWLTATLAAVTTLLFATTVVLRLGTQAGNHATAGANLGGVLSDIKALWTACETDRLSDAELIDRLRNLKDRSLSASRPLATTRVRHKLLLRVAKTPNHSPAPMTTGTRAEYPPMPLPPPPPPPPAPPPEPAPSPTPPRGTDGSSVSYKV